MKESSSVTVVPYPDTAGGERAAPVIGERGLYAARVSNDEAAPGAPPPSPTSGPTGEAPVPQPGQGAAPLPVPTPAAVFPATYPTSIEPPAPSGSWDLDLAAASLRMDTGDTDQLFQALGEKLERILPRRVEIRRGGGLLRRQRVDKISVDAGDNRLEAVRGRSGPVFLTTHTVRGIALQSSEISADDWLERLVVVVGAESARSNDVRTALGKLLE
jgi:hypothetical protein